jgi:hypothetical protein
MKLKANRPLAGSYGYVQQGQQFDTDEDTAQQLMKRGLAEPWREPVVVVQPPISVEPEAKAVDTYEVKIIEPRVDYAVKSEPLSTETFRRGRGRPRKA